MSEPDFTGFLELLRVNKKMGTIMNQSPKPKPEPPKWADTQEDDGEWPGWVYDMKNRMKDAEKRTKEAEKRAHEAELDAARRKEQRDAAREVADDAVRRAEEADSRARHLNESLANLIDEIRMPKVKVTKTDAPPVLAPVDRELQTLAIETTAKLAVAQHRLEETQHRLITSKGWTWVWFLALALVAYAGWWAYDSGRLTI